MTKVNETALIEPQYEYIYQDEDGNVIPVYYQYEENESANQTEEFQFVENIKDDDEIIEGSYFIEEEFGEPYIFQSSDQIQTNKNQQQQQLQIFENEKSEAHIDQIIQVVANGDFIFEEKPKKKGPTMKECEYCGVVVKHPSKIEAHMRTHTGERPYSCSYCGKTFTQRTPWKSHIKRHLGDTPYKCSYCSKTFPNPSTCKAHEKRVHNKKPKCIKPSDDVIGVNIAFKKPTENDQLSNSDAVVEIITTKTVKDGSSEEKEKQQAKVYICQVCGVNLQHPSKVDSHMLNHIGYKYKPFQCEYCDLLLSSASTYNVHIKRFHSTDRPYQCQWECGKTFHTVSNRNEHEKIVHHKLKRYQCCIENCNKLFTRRLYLCNHFTKCHPDWDSVPDEMKGNRVVAVPCSIEEEEISPGPSDSKLPTRIAHSDGTVYLVDIIGPLGQPPFRDPMFVEDEYINGNFVNNGNFEDTSQFLNQQHEMIVQNNQDLEKEMCFSS